MRKHIFRITIILFSLFGCTACFDIQEDVFFNKDGSGNFSFIINLEQVKSMMAMFDDGKSNDKVSKTKPMTKSSPNEVLNSDFEKTKLNLLKTEGISNVKIIEDTIHFKFGLSFNFKDIAVLNKAMNKLFEDDSVKSGNKEIVYFEKKDKQLIRNEALDTKSILSKSRSISYENDKKANNLFSGLDQLFSTVSYTTNYEFENKIESSLNTNSALSDNKKKVTIKCFPFAALKDSTQKKCTIANIIILK